MSDFEPLKEVKRSVLLDTDIGPDCDDVGAIVILHALARKYGIKISALCSCTSNPYTCGTIDVINKWCESEDIPIGITGRQGFFDGPDTMYYNKGVSEKFGTSYVPVGNKVPHNAAELYIRELEKADDNSVIFITIGMLNNVAEIIDKAPELLKKKVYAFVTMAGRQHDKQKEFNVVCDADAFVKFTEFSEKAGVPVYYSPFETGVNVLSGFTEEFDGAEEDPVFCSYRDYLAAMRPVKTLKNSSFDLTAVHFAFEGEGHYYKLSSAGKMFCEADTYETIFTEGEGIDRCIELACEEEELGEFFSEYMRTAHHKA